MNDIIVGQVSGVFGCRGCIRVRSFTRPQQNIQKFKSWLIGEDRESYKLLEAKQSSPGIIARLEGVDNRNHALELMHENIMVDKCWLEKLPETTYYWFELVGLSVINKEDQSLGIVKKLLETGANDVLIVESEKHRCLIPYIKDTVILEVDLQDKQIKVDWKVEWCDAN